MNIKVLFSFCIFFLGTSCLQSCQEDVKSMDTSLLSGEWVVVNAKRNSRATTTLNEAYFVFSDDRTMKTNFMGEDITGEYKISGNVINQETEDKFSYTIVDLSKDTLILATKIRDYDFEFFLLNERLDPFGKNEEEDQMEKEHSHITNMGS